MQNKKIERKRNMLKNLLALFRKSKAEETKPLNTSFIEDVEAILKIKCPKIEDVACIFEYPFDGQPFVIAVQEKDFDNDLVPTDVPSMTGYYLDGQNVIFLSGKILLNEYASLKMHYTTLIGSEKLFYLIHELRHVWQKQYASELYYKKNAVGIECINDIAEIDADAFAISYFFSERTLFTYENVPNIADELAFQATIDGGKRWKRVEELSKEFGFTNHDKLEDFKKSIDQDKVKNMVKLLKLQEKI